MYAGLVCVVYGAVTPGTGFRNVQTGIRKEFACFVGQFLLCVRIKAIGAYSCILVTRRQRRLVHAVKRQGELFGMTLLAGCVIFQLDITQSLGRTLRMRETTYI